MNGRRVEAALEAVLEALESESAFVAASSGDGQGVLKFLGLNAGVAKRTYNAREWEADATLGSLGSTRFGAAARKQRAHAKAADFDPKKLAAQGFAWSTAETVRQASDVQAAGSAYYLGWTHAADSKGKLYEGSMTVHVRFSRNAVDGLVEHLETSDGEAWTHGLGGAVARIALPRATLSPRTGSWSVTGKEARVSYAPQAGAFPDDEVSGAEFSGRLLGRDAESGSEAVGVWKVDGDDTTLAGGFGAWDVFAYIPAEAFMDSPGTGTATYRGKTVAVGESIFYTGDLEALVMWGGGSSGGSSDSDSLGTIRLTVSDLISTDLTYGRLLHGLPHYENADGRFTDTDPRPGTYEVESLSFTANIEKDGAKRLSFKSRLNSKLKVRYNTLLTKDDGSLVGGDGQPEALKLPSDITSKNYNDWLNTESRPNIDSEPKAHIKTLETFFRKGGDGENMLNVSVKDYPLNVNVRGWFVDQDGESPLAIVGTWGTTYINGGMLGVGNERVSIDGAFGAELVP